MSLQRRDDGGSLEHLAVDFLPDPRSRFNGRRLARNCNRPHRPPFPRGHFGQLTDGRLGSHRLALVRPPTPFDRPLRHCDQAGAQHDSFCCVCGERRRYWRARNARHSTVAAGKQRSCSHRHRRLAAPCTSRRPIGGSSTARRRRTTAATTTDKRASAEVSDGRKTHRPATFCIGRRRCGRRRPMFAVWLFAVQSGRMHRDRRGWLATVPNSWS